MPLKRRKKIICPKQFSPTMRFVEPLKWKMFGNSKLFSYHLLRRPGNTSWPSLVPERTLRSSTIHTVKFAINKESFNFKESTNRLSMTALSSCRVPAPYLRHFHLSFEIKPFFQQMNVFFCLLFTKCIIKQLLNSVFA